MSKVEIRFKDITLLEKSLKEEDFSNGRIKPIEGSRSINLEQK